MQVLLWKDFQERAISFFGDLHPTYKGNVVKAMASAKDGFPTICRWLKNRPSSLEPTASFFEKLDGLLKAHVWEVNRLTPTIVEVVIKAPLAAQSFYPGQFYRLQNYESLQSSSLMSMGMEGLALTGASVDKEQGLISTIVLEMGGSSSLCSFLKPDEPVVFMGPIGAPTEIAEKETVLLVGGGLGNAVLFSIGKAFREKGSKVLYVAGYKKMQDRFKEDEIEAAADQVIWVCEEAPGFSPKREQDLAFVGNILQALEESGKRGMLLPMDRLIVIGSDRLMAALTAAKNSFLAPYFQKNPSVIASINSPMQCMMKGICGQCLQRQINPETGIEKLVYSCVNQDQPADLVDFASLTARLSQNSVQEKLTSLYQKFCIKL